MLGNGVKRALILTLGLMAPCADAGDDWELISEKDGFKVYRLEASGSGLVAFKGVKVMPAPVTKVAQVILDDDVEKKKEWIDMIKDFQVIERGTLEAVTYSAYDLPWPLANRDYVIQSSIHIDNEAKQVTIALKSVEHAAAPQTIGVRADLTRSRFKLVPLSAVSTEVTAEIQTDPKGNLPKWLINLIQRRWPVNTLRKMEAQALRPETPENTLIKTRFTAAHELAKH